MKRLSFKTKFKMESLLPFTGCRKVLGKMPGSGVWWWIYFGWWWVVVDIVWLVVGVGGYSLAGGEWSHCLVKPFSLLILSELKQIK